MNTHDNTVSGKGTTMAGLAGYPATAVLRAEDYDRAKRFYTEVLGLQAQAAAGPTREGLFAAGAGTSVSIYERPGMPAPQNTTLSFAVPPDAFDGVVADLRARGVVFEEYDLPEIGLKTVSGVAEFDGARVAWFLDTEGNIVVIGTM
jgi:catechol 2,3-dioxygenase-like lactoylglutathione lyase family enzyme